MAQVSLSNIDLSFIKEQFNISGPISFSKLYNYSTDLPRTQEISISELVGKYRQFLPSDETGLLNWYDASTLYIDGYKNNQTVSLLRDLSGNNRDATQTIVNYQPVYYNNLLNGKPSISFIDITSTHYKFLNFNTVSQATAITIAAVFNTSGSKTNYLLSTSTATSGNIHIYHGYSKTPHINIYTTLNQNNNINEFIYLDFVPVIYIIKIYIDNDTITKSQLRYNGTEVPIFNHDNSLTNLILGNMYIGGNPSSVNNNLNGSISEVIIYDHILSDDRIYELEGYLASKWWNIPSYVLPTTHKYYYIPVLNLYNSPSLLYIYDRLTHNSFNVNLNNYGIEARLLNGIIDNTNYDIYSPYYSGFTNHLNSIFIWYKFDTTNNYIYTNIGYGGTIYNLINPSGKTPYISSYIRGDGCLNLSPTEISTTNTIINYINFSTLSNEYTFAFWYRDIALTGGNDTLFSLSFAYLAGNKFYIQRDGATNNINIFIPNTLQPIKVYNAIYGDNKWRYIAICLKKSFNTNTNVNDIIVSIYLNGINIYNDLTIGNGWFGNYNCYISLNQYATGIGLYSGYGANMLYDDFRIYTKYLNYKQIQQIMGYPISLQDGVRNQNAYLWSSYDTNITPCLNINYTNFINYFFKTDNTYTISYNLQILNDSAYTSDFETVIIHCNNNNIDKLKIVHRYFTSATNYIKIIINDITTTNTVIQYFQNISNDNLCHNYIFKIPITLTGSNTIELLIDGVVASSVVTSFTEPLVSGQFVKIGTYNDNVSVKNTAPMKIEDFRIYNRTLTIDEINYINTNYNLTTSYLYGSASSNIFPFNYLKFENCYASSNAYGPTYSNMINYYSSNGSWIYNLNYLNNFNGIQKFTIPESGYYKITCAGACGGKSYTTPSFGNGIIVSNIKYLHSSNIIDILVGQKGADGTFSLRPNEKDLHGQGGGGGMSAVIDSITKKPILIAGAGGGSGENIVGGENATGMDAVYTTFSSTDKYGYSAINYNGMGGKLGAFGTARGVGCGGAGFYEDGHNKASIYNGHYNGICYSNIAYGSNIGYPFYQNYGGIGGFPGGATGGTNLSLDLVWGGGGGSGYSGGSGGSAGSYQGQTLGGCGGGSFDIGGIFNNATINKKEGLIGYNNTNGYVKINYLTYENFLDYANINNNISRDGLKVLLDPSNNISYDIDTTPSSMINLVDGTYASLNNSYTYSSNKDGAYIRLYNTSSYIDANKDTITINANGNIQSISIWYKMLSVPPDYSHFVDTFTDYGFITTDSIGRDFYDGIRDIDVINGTYIGDPESAYKIYTGGSMYIDSSNVTKNIIWDDLVYPLNTWRNVTFLSHSNLNDYITLFGNTENQSGINVEFGPILIYDRIISINEHLNNFFSYANNYVNYYQFFYVGVEQTYIVPDNVSKIFVKAWGSSGGSSLTTAQNGISGSGPFISCTIKVKPGDVLTFAIANGGDHGFDSTISYYGYPDNLIQSRAIGVAGNGGTSYIKNGNEYLLKIAGGGGSGYFKGTYDLINTSSYVQSYVAGVKGGNFLTGYTPINPDTVDFVVGNSTEASYYNPLYCENITLIEGKNGDDPTNTVAVNNTDGDYPNQNINICAFPPSNNGRNSFILLKNIY
jgi:hypothetical protein